MRACLDASQGRSKCAGAVEYRESLSGTGTAIPRCDKHWSERLDQQERINARYAPFSDCPPDGVSYAEWSDDY